MYRETKRESILTGFAHLTPVQAYDAYVWTVGRYVWCFEWADLCAEAFGVERTTIIEGTARWIGGSGPGGEPYFNETLAQIFRSSVPLPFLSVKRLVWVLHRKFRQKQYLRRLRKQREFDRLQKFR